MGIDFRIRDFMYPFSILKLRNTFNNNQWLREESLREYQFQRLRLILSHAYQNVPYYQKLFKKNNIIPRDIKTLKDLKNIPYLTKDILKENFNLLAARNAKKYKPIVLTTSGTTGGRISFYIDKPSNVLEFVHYWRAWGWAGYRLGDTFIELSAEFFTYSPNKVAISHYYNRPTGRLLINSLYIARRYIDEFISLFRRFKPLFMKGLPSNLFMLALVLNEKPDHGISLRGIFSQGENLMPHQRALIEKTFSARVYDLYGHMERTAAIAQCPYGTYHIHPDYGLVEFEDPEITASNTFDSDMQIKEIVGTSLYNFSMPLIRYRTGDLVTLKRSAERCKCRRTFPSVESIIGRETDVVITPDGRAITALYTVFDRTPGIVTGQIIQDKRDRIVVKVVIDFSSGQQTHDILTRHLKSFVGTNMDIHIMNTTVDELQKDNKGKFKTVVSNIPYKAILDS